PFCTGSRYSNPNSPPALGTWSGSASSDQFDPALLRPGTHEVISHNSCRTCQSADN
ncbi:MAG: hypothetical protein IPP25_13560, partial [Saprospiraceae bacterium]|nr:hypothetical protein [Candidatus Opimibacter skivensis]